MIAGIPITSMLLTVLPETYIHLVRHLTSEKIVAWKITSGLPVRDTNVNNGYYPDGTLSITGTTDENGNQVREYTDKSGRVILKKNTGCRDGDQS